jgi:hypothetical protein
VPLSRPVVYLAIVLVALGCNKSDGPKGVTVHGRLVQNGQPFKALPNEDVMVGFSPVGAAPGQAAPGASSDLVKPADGSFTLTGRDKKGLPPGKYTVSLSSQVGYSGDNRFEKMLAGKPALVVEVGPEEGQTFIIDVDKWSATKQ